MDFTKLDGLIPAVVQDDDTGEVLMVGFMDDDALQLTLSTGFATFYSRSRKQLWVKGETSGNRLAVRRVLTDCDDDSIVLRVVRLGEGNVCHTGTRSCFTREILPLAPLPLVPTTGFTVSSQTPRPGSSDPQAGGAA